MKRKLLSLAVALLCSVGSWAGITSGSDYLIKNVATGYYLVGGMDWGTHACLHKMPQWFTFTSHESAYTIDSHQFNNSTAHFLGTGLYVDEATTDWTVSETATSGVYTISNGGNYLAGNGTDAVITTTTDGTAAEAQWQLISKSDFETTLATATAASGVDATPYIKDPELKRNGNFITYSTHPWTIKSFDGSADPGNFAQGQDGNNASCAESYRSSNGFKATQTLTGLRAGKYELTAQAFYRQDGSDKEHMPYLFVGDQKSIFPERTGTENNMPDAYASFLNGTYPVDAIEFLVTSTSQEINIGYANENVMMWNIFGQTQLTYYGNAVAFYSPASFTNSTEAAAGAWKSYNVNAGWYKIASNAAITFYYTQDDSDDADGTSSTSIAKDGYTYLKLDEGKLYFKSSANATLTLTEGFVANDDITAFFLTNPNFTGNADGWEGGPSYQSNNVEKYNTTFDVYQTATDLPAGYYWIKAHAFDRETDQTATYGSASSVSKAYLYAGSASTLVKRIYDDASSTKKNSGTNELSFTKGETTVWVPNRPSAGEKYFGAGLYDNELLMYHSGGDLRIGIKKYVKTSNDWCLFDNFRLIYAGSTPSNGADMTSLITNPSFESDDTGWTTTGGLYIRTTEGDLSNKVGSKYAMMQGKTTNRKTYQSLSSLVEGKYVLSINAKANSDAGTVTLNMGTFSTTIPVGTDAATYYVAYETAVSDATAEINISNSGGTGDLRRSYFDNFTLTYYETLPEVSGVDDLLASAMAGDVRAALDAANTAYTGSKTVANYNALQTAIINAKVSIAEYAANKNPNADWTGVIVNPSFTGTYTDGASGTTQGWTITGTSGNRQFNAGAAESWRNNNVVFSQVIKSLPAGTYKLTAQVDNCHDDANVSLYATCNGTTYSAVAPYRACATNYATTSSDLAGDESLCLTTLYLKVEEGKDLTIGAKDESTSGGWMIFDNFKLTYDPTLPESVTAVVGKMNGSVESTQTSAVNTYNTTNNIDNLVAAQAAIYAATKSKVVYTEITTIKSNYDTKAAALDATGQAAYAAGTSATKYTNGTYVTASEAETAYHDDYIAAVKAQDTDNADMTDLIVNPSFEYGYNLNPVTGWTVSVAQGGGTGETSRYKTDNGGGLGEGGGSVRFFNWTPSAGKVTVGQTIADLEPGTYKLSAYVVSYANNVVTLKAGETSNPITLTDGNMTLIDVTFTQSSAGSLAIEFSQTGTWFELDNFHLTLLESYYANDADYAALNSAIESAEANTLGFENGEYAPYENISALTALAAANAINQSAANTKTSVQTATTNLTGATWTPNVGDVECVYNGDFSQGDWGLTGWDRPESWGVDVPHEGEEKPTHDEMIAAGASTGHAYYNQNGSLVYGTTGYYTMPLKENTIYTLTFKYASWEGGEAGDDGSNDGITVSVLNDSHEGMDEVEYEENNKKYDTSGAFEQKTIHFVTTSAGNYVLTLANKNNTVITDVSITKAASQTLTLPSATQYAAGTYPAVELGRTFTTTNWATVCVPFVFDKSNFEVKELSDITVTGDHISIKLDDASTIVAGKPYLVKATADDAKIAATNVAMPGASVQESSITKDPYTVSFVGTYEGESLTSANSNAWVVSKNQLWNVDSNVTVGAYRAYFTVTGTSVKALVFGDEETGINNLNVDDDLNKNEVIYNLAGQRVQKAVKGLYIKNGKKVVIK